MTKMKRRDSLKQSARSFFRSVLHVALKSVDTRQTRPIHFEPLESRQLMAGDFYDATNQASENLPNVISNQTAQFNATSMSTGGLEAEGEDAPNLVEFAKALQQAGVRFFGADWCPVCNEQKKLFEDGAQFLPFIEMTNPDRTRNATAISENVTQYPTWAFPNGTRVTGLQTLQQLSTLSGVAIPSGSLPTFTTIPNQTVIQGSPLHVPVDAYDPNGGPLTITVSSSNPSVIAAEMVTNNKSWKISVNGYGDMIFRLFADEAPRAVNRIESLTNSNFYDQSGTNKIIFHRVIDNFVLQAGDPTGTGSGGSNLGDFDDQFNLNLQHNRTGILSYAKSTDDTNDSQFFITEGPQRHLDFNHSVFGQIIEGDAAREGISRTSVNSGDRPVNEISINDASIFNDIENGLIRLKALAASGSSTITVQVEDAEGNRYSHTFVATAAADTANGAPFLNDITVPAISPGQTVNIQLASQDAEGDPVFYDATKIGNVDYQFNVNSSTGQLSVTAPTNFTGSFDLQVRVRDATQNRPTTQDKFDAQVLRFNVAASISTPTSVDLVSTTDSGSSDSDNVTNVATMQFVVNGTTAGATVNLKIGDQIVGTAVATGATTTITTNLVSQLGDGTRSIVATQTQNNQTSSASPALTVTYDSTSPAAIPASAFPTTANVGNTLSLDLASTEEGQGLRYALVSPPTGLTINANTGLMTWTPTSAQTGPQLINLSLTDLAGNSQTQTVGIGVSDAAKVSVVLQAFDSTNTNALTSASIGQEIVIRVLVNDLRTGSDPTGDGVFSAYLDVLYDSERLELTGATPITYSSTFGNGRSVAGTSTAGLIDELGAFSSFNVGPGRDPQLLATIRMKVKAAGQATLSTNAAESASRGFSIFKEDTAVPSDRVSFGSLNLAIGQNFTVANDTFNFDEDTSNNSLNVLTNDTIVTGSNAVLTIKSLGTPSNGGTVTISSDNKNVLYTPASNVNGQETFTYTVQDQNGATGTATVTVQLRAVNDNPVAVNDTLTTVKTTDTDVFINVLSNDTMGPDAGETLTVSQVGSPSQGGSVRVGTGGNGVVYTPKAGFTGNETFTYTLSDGNGGTSTATVTVTVSPAAPPPTVVGESFSITEDAAASEFDVLSNDTPAETGQTLSIVDVKAPNGTATITSNGSKITFTPKANFSGQELVVYTVRGSNGGQANGTATFTIAAVNDAPDAVNDTLRVLASSSQPLNVLANDPLVDAGDVYTITAVTQPETGKGSVTIGSNGKTIQYTAPSASFTGTVTFTYTISDGTATDTATVTLNVDNYTPRDVGIQFFEFDSLPVTVEYIPNSAGNFQNTALTLIGTDSGVRLNNVGPGDYKFSLPDLPFVDGSAQTVVVQSALADSSSLTTSINPGTRSARYIDLRDFMGQNLRKGLTSAVTTNSQASWSIGQGDWNNFKNIKVAMNTAGNQLTINATNASNQNVQATLPVSDSKVVLRGKEGDASLFRIQANPSELSFTPVTSSSASGEGEGSTLNASLVDQAMQQVTSVQESVASGALTAMSPDLDDIGTWGSTISNGYRRGFRTR